MTNTWKIANIKPGRFSKPAGFRWSTLKKMKIPFWVCIIIVGLTTSCDRYRLKDHYRINKIGVEVLEVASGSNDSCVYLFNESITKKSSPVFAVKLIFIREYYSDEESPFKFGLMMFPQGWEGSKEKISRLDLLLKGTDSIVRITDLLVQDKLVSGYSMTNMPSSFTCQNESCTCAYLITYPSLSNFLKEFNSQIEKFKGPRLEDVPLLLFVEKKRVSELLADSITIQAEILFDKGSRLIQESKKVRLVPANTSHDRRPVVPCRKGSSMRQMLVQRR